MSELDDVLRQSFARIAEPGDPAGVVAAMRARMGAGDTGTPAATSGFSTGAGWVVPWLFGGALLAIGGLLLGSSGLIGTPFATASANETQGLVHYRTDALDCPDGTPVATLAAGNRVLAIARSDDGSYVGVRNPFDTATIVWLPTEVVYPDADEAAVDSLPVDGCPVIDVTEVDPTPTAAPTAAPTETQTPTPPAADRTAPAVSGATASPTQICYTGSGFSPTASTVSVTATDNVGVAGVTATWMAVGGSPASLTRSGTTWSFVFSSPAVTSTTPVTITLTARDAAGNVASVSTVVTVLYNSSPCQLI